MAIFVEVIPDDTIDVVTVTDQDTQWAVDVINLTPQAVVVEVPSSPAAIAIDVFIPAPPGPHEVLVIPNGGTVPPTTLPGTVIFELDA